MFHLFKKKPKTQDRITIIEPQKLKEKLDSIPLLHTRPSESFFTELIDVFNFDFLDSTNPIHQKFLKDFKQNINILSPFYSAILESAFKNEAVDKFTSQLKDSLNQNNNTQFLVTSICVYWFQLTYYFKDKIESKHDKELLSNYEGLIDSLKTINDKLKYQSNN